MKEGDNDNDIDPMSSDDEKIFTNPKQVTNFTNESNEINKSIP